MRAARLYPQMRMGAKNGTRRPTSGNEHPLAGWVCSGLCGADLRLPDCWLLACTRSGFDLPLQSASTHGSSPPTEAKYSPHVLPVVFKVHVFVERPPMQQPVRPVEPGVVQVVQHDYTQYHVQHLEYKS